MLHTGTKAGYIYCKFLLNIRATCIDLMRLYTMKKALIFFFLVASYVSNAQDPDFTQPQFNWSAINPAYAGSLASARAEIGTRLQWPALSGYFNTYHASYDQYFKAGGAGINYMFDDAAGTIRTNRIDLNYSYGFQLWKDGDGKGKVVVQPGVQLSWQHKSVNWNKLALGDQIDPRRGFVYNTSEVPSNTSVSNIDLSAGLLLYSKRFLFGFSVYHLTEPDEGLLGSSRLPMRSVIHAAGIIGNADPESDALSIIPSVIYMQQMNGEMALGMITAKYRGAMLGIGYRNRDALLFSGGYTWKNMTLAYSYDLTISKLGQTGGSHEVHVRYCFLKDKWAGRRNLRAFF